MEQNERLNDAKIIKGKTKQTSADTGMAMSVSPSKGRWVRRWLLSSTALTPKAMLVPLFSLRKAFTSLARA